VTRTRAKKVVILDRDGTIVIDRHYLSDPAGLEFLPGAADGLKSLHESGHRLVVITNQSGIGRGLFTLERLQAMNARLREMVLESGARLDGIYFCPHRPEDNCDCRKPGTRLLFDAASELGFDPADAVVIGDKDSDTEFGQRAGTLTMLVSRGESKNVPRAADYVVRDLREAATILRTLE
jgi:D-glycero-D-manno-heptose 1,7-bisphosphate phosphatase